MFQTNQLTFPIGVQHFQQDAHPKYQTHSQAFQHDLNHHPNINFTYGFCEIKIQTHDVNGISELDFNLVERIDKINFSKI